MTTPTRSPELETQLETLIKEWAPIECHILDALQAAEELGYRRGRAAPDYKAIIEWAAVRAWLGISDEKSIIEAICESIERARERGRAEGIPARQPEDELNAWMIARRIVASTSGETQRYAIRDALLAFPEITGLVKMLADPPAASPATPQEEQP